ncbi:MAG: tryptophan/tyrosine permease [Desulfobacteraceae bacterium]|nr:tryptophan/tyrosine permease [Desulfobacteraceae bacterium]
MNGKTIPSKMAIFLASLLVLGNVLGVGVLALPISAGLGGFFPALIGIFAMWLLMLFSAFLIAYRIDGSKKNFDLPSFYQAELGNSGKWIAIICNLIILYGVLVAYLSGMATMLANLFPSLVNYLHLIIIIYCSILVALIVFGLKVLHKGMSFVMIILWICFIIMLITSAEKFHPKLLTFTDWKYLPVCLPIAISTFHFHNIIPTVCSSLNFDKPATYKAIFIGVFLGLIINLLWVIVVLGSLPENHAGTHSIIYAQIHNLTANVPLSKVLHNQYFTISALIFAVFAVTSSFMTNGAGLLGFIKDLCFKYAKTDNKLLVGTLSFLPPLAVTLIYPNLFLKALAIVGGVGETILFAILPGLIMVKISHSKTTSNHLILKIIGYIMTFIGIGVMCFVLGQKFGFFILNPPLLQ